MKRITFIVAIIIISFGCRIDAIRTNKENYNYCIEITNKTNENILIVGFLNKKNVDTIVINKFETFKKEISWSSWGNNFNSNIFSDTLYGNRDSTLIVFNNKKYITNSYLYPNSKFEWLNGNFWAKKPQRGFKTYNPSSDTFNLGTFNYSITNEDYESARQF